MQFPNVESCALRVYRMLINLEDMLNPEQQIFSLGIKSGKYPFQA